MQYYNSFIIYIVPFKFSMDFYFPIFHSSFLKCNKPRFLRTFSRDFLNYDSLILKKKKRERAEISVRDTVSHVLPIHLITVLPKRINNHSLGRLSFANVISDCRYHS